MAAQSFGSPFTVAVPRTDIDAALRAYGIRYRRRTFDPTTTILLWAGQIASQDKSCRHAVSRLLAYHAAHGRTISAATGAYTMARQRLDIRIIQRLTRDLARRLENRYAKHRPIDRPVLAVDGTGLSGSDTPSLQEAYPQGRHYSPGLGFPMIRSALIVSVTTGAIIDLALAPCKGIGTSENALLRQMWDRLEAGDVVVGDRFYSNYWNMALLAFRGVGCVFRKNKLYRLENLPVDAIRGRSDRVSVLRRPPNTPKWVTPNIMCRVPDQCLVRWTVLRAEGVSRSSRIELLSTLTESGISKADLSRIYGSRWHIELDIRSLKVDLGMDILRTKSADMLRKELWMTALTYNVIRSLMARAADRKGCAPRELSFSAARQVIEAFAPRLDTATGGQADRLLDQMLDAMGQHIVGNRPNRFEPRLVKRRPKPARLMMVPRDEARRAYWRDELDH